MASSCIDVVVDRKNSSEIDFEQKRGGLFGKTRVERRNVPMITEIMEIKIKSFRLGNGVRFVNIFEFSD